MNQVKLEQTLKQRVIEVVNLEYKTSVNKFASVLGIRQTTLNDQINGKGKISAAVIISLLSTHPDISAEWLLRGTGSMLLTEPQHETHTRPIRDDSETEELRERLRRAEREIDGLYERIKELKGDIATTHLSVATA